MLWLAKGLGKGGMEQLLLNHARAGNRTAFSYRAAYLVDRPHSVVEDLRSEGVPVQRLGSGRIMDPRWIRDLLAELKDGRSTSFTSTPLFLVPSPGWCFRSPTGT